MIICSMPGCQTTVGCICRPSLLIPPAYNHCTCDCHRGSGKIHLVPCCSPVPSDAKAYFNAGIEAAAAYHDHEALRYAGMGKRYSKRQATHEICAAQIRCLKRETTP